MTRDTVLATFDARPYFERVLSHALRHGLIGEDRIAALKREGAKAIVQLATFFGTASLRPELEAARVRLVNLVGLALEAESGGKIEAAVALLAQKSLLALSKTGADRLRALLRLPTHATFAALALTAEDERLGLARWTLEEPMTFARYLAEKRKRENSQAYQEMSYWLAARFGLARGDLQALHLPCESLVNSALLVLFVEKNPKGLFSADRFMQLHEAARKRRKLDFPALEAWRDDAPAALQPHLDKACAHFLESVLPVIKHYAAVDIYQQQDRFSGLFHFDSSNVEDLTHHDKVREKEWHRITAGKGAHTDVQCTVLLMVACGLAPAAVLRKQDAVRIWTQLRDTGFNDKAVLDFIHDLVPFEYQSDIERLWAEDLGPEARVQLDEADQSRALAYLHETCRAGWKATRG